jgi:hypothetical protein
LARSKIGASDLAEQTSTPDKMKKIKEKIFLIIALLVSRRGVPCGCPFHVLHFISRFGLKPIVAISITTAEAGGY